MKLRVSLTSLLLALCLSSGTAGPLQGSGTGAGDAVGSGVGNAIGEGAKEAVSSGIQDAIDKGEGSSAFRGARGDAFRDRLQEGAHALDNTGREAGRQAEDLARQGVNTARHPASWGASGGHGVFDSHGSYGGQGQGNFRGPWSPSGHGYPGHSEGSFGTNSLGGSLGQGGDGGYPHAQEFVAQPGYDSVRGGSQDSGCTNAPPTGSDGNSGGSWQSSSHNGGSGSSGGHGGSNSGNGGSNGGDGGRSPGSSHGVETSRDFDQSFSVSKGTNSDTGSRGTSGGAHKPECENPENEPHIAGGSRNEENTESNKFGNSQSTSQGQEPSKFGEGDKVVSELHSVGSSASPEVFNFDTFWKNLKSKLGFINWDAFDKDERRNS